MIKDIINGRSENEIFETLKTVIINVISFDDILELRSFLFNSKNDLRIKEYIELLLSKQVHLLYNFDKIDIF